MKQNIYDDRVFFDSYITYRNNPLCLNNTVEQPTLLSCLPDLSGKDVMDIGCGTGLFSLEALKRGAKSVLGLDISSRMCKEAKRRAKGPIEIINCPVEDYETDRTFHVIVSSLMLHYVQDYLEVLKRIAGWLRRDGTFIFSVNHPNYTSDLMHVPEFGSGKEMPLRVERYQDEGVRRHYWFVEDVVKYHRTLQTYLGGLIDVGFQVRRLLEPRPLSDVRNAIPELRSANRRPVFMVVVADKLR